MPVVDAHAAGSLAPALVEVIAQRPLRLLPRRPAALSGWQAIASLMRQQWQPDLRDERPMRISAGAIDILLHTILIGLFLWLMYVRLMMPPAPEEDSDSVVQVEFIGRGNVAEGGGALATAGAQSGPASAAPTSRAVTPMPATGMPDAPVVSLPVPQPPQVRASGEAPQLVRALPAPAVAVEAAQPLQVSEVREPAPQAFQLPPTKLRELQLPQLQMRDLQPVQQVEAIATLKPQPVQVLKPREVKAELRAPKLQQEVQNIEVPQPLAAPPVLAVPTQATSSLQMPQMRGEVTDIPMPPGGAPTPSTQSGNGVAQQANVAAGVGGERGTAPAAGTMSSGIGQGTQAAVQGGRGVAATGTGAGPGSKPAPGGWPGAAKSDDWGASSRKAAGTGTGNGLGKGKGRDGDGKPGLFNRDGSTRLSDNWAEQSGVDVDRAGTWLKRPGLEYRGTRFDQYWVPGGTLLEEWVRKGIKQVSIPIPGSKRQLRCVVSMLPPGAICNPYSPDVNEQPARARPPPDVPFKPELQEDNGSVKPSKP